MQLTHTGLDDDYPSFLAANQTSSRLPPFGVCNMKWVQVENVGPCKGTLYAKMPGLPSWGWESIDWIGARSGSMEKISDLFLVLVETSLNFWILQCPTACLSQSPLFPNCLPSASLSGPNARPAVKTASATSFFVHMYWSAGETTAVL